MVPIGDSSAVDTADLDVESESFSEAASVALISATEPPLVPS